MKNKIIKGFVLFSCLLLLTGCTDSIFSNMFGGDSVKIDIALNIPGESSASTRAIRTRVGGQNQWDNHLDENTTYQRYIADDDCYVLVFQKSEDSASEWELYAVPTITTITGENGDQTRNLNCLLDKPEEEMTVIIDVITNLVENGVYTSTTDAKSALKNMIGQKRENVYSTIGSFTCPKNTEDNPYGLWYLNSGNGTRYLPMWGQSYNQTDLSLATYTITPETDALNAYCGLYRSVAKMGVIVDETCNTFQLKEIYVYYPNNLGTFVSLPVAGDDGNWTASRSVQYTLPEVPNSSTTREIEYPLAYKLENALGAGGQYLNNIYVAEADNKNASNNSLDPVCLVVGGIYTGGDYNGEGLSSQDYPLDYYRIDLNSEATESTTLGSGPYDIVRNHSYIFNILEANSPGSSDPDPRRATAGLKVEILDYTDVPLNGINSQYILNVNQSLFAFEGATTAVGELKISTVNESWEIVTEWAEENENGVEETKETADWVHITDTQEGSHTNDGDIVTIEPEANVNTDENRSTSFFIKCGDVLKRIYIVQDETETANSYYVTEEGTYDLKIDIRGNGNTKAWTNDVGTSTEDIDFDMTDSIPQVAYAAIIWETADGFVTIPNPYDISESGCISYQVNNVSLNSYGDWTGNVFDAGNGANALIGVFDESNQLLWSYHIWGLGDYQNGALTEQWRVGSNGENYYYFMDRNLGAYSNLPGSKSFGLLYQWGRKDPFIGAYRESREQDYRQVRKQYTRHYQQKNDTTYVWSNFDDSGNASTADQEGSLVKHTISNPTQILEDGLLSADHATNEAKGLWGTEDYGYDTSETGNKTMYDPCPPGYRVPSLNALTIYDGGNNDMWATTQKQHSEYTARFVPVKDGDDYRSGNGYSADFISDAPFYGFWFDYSGAAGFADTYNEQDSTGVGTGYEVNYYSATTLENGTCGWMTGYSNSNPGKPSYVTWIPMAGIYNGTMNHFGRAGLTDRNEFPDGSVVGAYLPASSLQVSSVLWANSPTSTNEDYPAGLLIHGTEGAYAPLQSDGETFYQYSAGTANGDGTGNGTSSTVATEGPGYWITETTGYSSTACGWWTGSVDAGKSSMDSSIPKGQWNVISGAGNDNILNYDYWSDQNGWEESGRHFHSYAETEASTLANPSYAASVRCIRDKDAIEHLNDSIYYASGDTTILYKGETLDLYQFDTGEDQDCIELAIFYIQSWEVTSPGAKWLSISPASGSSNDSQGATSTIKITYNSSVEDLTEGDTAQITISFARGDTQTITVQYVGGERQN